MIKGRFYLTKWRRLRWNGGIKKDHELKGEWSRWEDVLVFPSLKNSVQPPQISHILSALFLFFLRLSHSSASTHLLYTNISLMCLSVFLSVCLPAPTTAALLSSAHLVQYNFMAPDGSQVRLFNNALISEAHFSWAIRHINVIGVKQDSASNSQLMLCLLWCFVRWSEVIKSNSN